MPDDASLAAAAARAAAGAAQAARQRPLEARVKGVAADVVTAADEAAEAAAVAVLRERRPGDGLLGEEGTRAAAAGGRRWLVDGVDGTVAFAAGIPSWCAAVALEDGAGPLAAAVHDPATDETYVAARGRGAWVGATSPGGAPHLSVRAARPLSDAVVATFWRPDRLVLPGVRAAAHALLDRVALIRHAGPGSLELAWVASGRLDAWAQPAVDPWDWLPGALLVTEAGGAARVVEAAGTRWHLAGPAALVDELAGLLAG